MARARVLEPEWLDTLPADDSRAVRSRGDLRRINTLMLQTGIMARALLAQSGEAPRTLIDLGSGDGTFMLRVARQLASHWPRVTVILLDHRNIVGETTRAGFRALGWQAEPVAADVFDFLERALEADVVIANLFLHHFSQEPLARLLALVAHKARIFAACEPRRALFPLFATRMLWAIGANDVSRHDAAASVRAGFAGRELSALWPHGEAWTLCEGAARLFTHLFVARRGNGGA